MTDGETISGRGGPDTERAAMAAPMVQGATGTPEAPAAAAIPQKLTFDEVIRELRMMQVEIEQYKSTVCLGSLKALRLLAIDKACLIVEHAQREHNARKRAR